MLEPSLSRKYAYLLVVLILMMAVTAIGLLYHQLTSVANIENKANDYHLRSMLNCVEIKDEVHHIFMNYVDNQLTRYDSKEKIALGEKYKPNLSLFSIRERLDFLKERQRHYDSSDFLTTLKEIDNLFQRVSLLNLEKIDSYTQLERRETMNILSQLEIHLEQLFRLHMIHYQREYTVILPVTKKQGMVRLTIILSIICLIGLFFIAKIFNLMKLTEKSIIETNANLNKLVDERTDDLSKVNKLLHLENQEREKLIQELQKALSEIKTLRGILPVCCVCGLIRDDTGVEQGKGEWMKVDTFIHQKTDAKVSHSYCLKCGQEAMGKVEDYVKKNKKVRLGEEKRTIIF